MKQVIPVPKHYAWGSDDSQNLLKQIYLNSLCRINDGKRKENLFLEAAQEKTWAELWVGTHLSGMSMLSHEDKTLLELLQEDLPFLFKVLSIKKCLSIQTHPDKASAALLHQIDPGNYPDASPKPEMAIAIDALDAFCGFCSPQEVLHNLSSYSATTDLIRKYFPNTWPVNAGTFDHFDLFVKKLIELFNSLSSNVLESLIKQIVEEINSRQEKSFRDGCMLKMWQEFGNDSGILVSLLLKIVRLGPLEAIVIPPFVPHAYISGTIFEFMACSDNVIRLGLTPKFKDADNFLRFFEYNFQTSTCVKPRPYAIKDIKATLFHYPTQFSEYFNVYILKSGWTDDQQSEDIDFEVRDSSVIFNFGRAVSLQNQLLEKYEFAVIQKGKLDIFCQHNELYLVLCSKRDCISA